MRIAATQRAALAAALRLAGPDQPTLCEGWTAHDLAAHVWLREHEPVSFAGGLIPALADRLKARMEAIKAERPFGDLVDAFAAGPGRWSPYAVPVLDDQANGTEYFIHCEDVRRGAEPWEPRVLDAPTAEWAWSQTRLFARLRLRRQSVALVLENLRTGEALRLGRGDRVVTVAGPPAEFLLWLSGRQDAARVSYYGAPDAIAEVKESGLKQ